MDAIVSKFVFHHRHLLELERRSSVKENRCLRGDCDEGSRCGCIRTLFLQEKCEDLYGRIVFTFVAPGGQNLPNHKISRGDAVAIGSPGSEIQLHTPGTVTRVNFSSLSIALDTDSDFSGLNAMEYKLVKISPHVSIDRMKKALTTLKKRTFTTYSDLYEVLFGYREPSAWPESCMNDISFFNKGLNLQQQEAVKFALLQKEIAIIHGPPGTGKTTTVTECIIQAVTQKLKVLVCAPSNVAVDNLMERLTGYTINMVRLGHPSRVSANLHPYLMDVHVCNRWDRTKGPHLGQEIDQIIDEMGTTDNPDLLWSLFQDKENKLRHLRRMKEYLAKQILSESDVVFCTLTSAAGTYIEKTQFDLLIIDECSQAMEAACWIPLLLAEKCILAGDHHQLPPTILSKKAADAGLKVSMMQRLLDLHGDGIKKLLTTQFRMNELIMQFSSQHFYNNKLVADETVRSSVLSDISGVDATDITSKALMLIDTSGCAMKDQRMDGNGSFGNEGEARVVAIHIDRLVRCGLQASSIAVITPYKFQVDLIRDEVLVHHPEVDVNSVDAFQGSEKEAVILSLVRSNEDGEVGFLAEERRMNVAMTRAKKHLAVICDRATVSCDPFIRAFLEYCSLQGDVRSASEYICLEKLKNKPNVYESHPKKRRMELLTVTFEQPK
ncbi:DNA-binding protein SMUBP-2 [Trichonephila clavipes]|nr:DNA-binding protein SMUBP-2 [Trichonephila clavipes]